MGNSEETITVEEEKLEPKEIEVVATKQHFVAVALDSTKGEYDFAVVNLTEKLKRSFKASVESLLDQAPDAVPKDRYDLSKLIEGTSKDFPWFPAWCAEAIESAVSDAAYGAEARGESIVLSPVRKARNIILSKNDPEAVAKIAYDKHHFGRKVGFRQKPYKPSVLYL